MKNYFNIKRFFKLLVYDFKRAYYVPICFAIAPILYYLILLLIFINNGTSAIFQDADSRIEIFLLCAFVMILIMPLLFFHNVNNRERGVSFIMLPASAFEKLLSMFTITFIISILIVPIGVLTDYLFVSAFPKVFINNDYKEFINSMFDDAFFIFETFLCSTGIFFNLYVRKYKYSIFSLSLLMLIFIPISIYITYIVSLRNEKNIWIKMNDENVFNVNLIDNDDFLKLYSSCSVMYGKDSITVYSDKPLTEDKCKWLNIPDSSIIIYKDKEICTNPTLKNIKPIKNRIPKFTKNLTSNTIITYTFYDGTNKCNSVVRKEDRKYLIDTLSFATDSDFIEHSFNSFEKRTSSIPEYIVNICFFILILLLLYFSYIRLKKIEY